MEYFVSQSGSDDAAGTEASPFLTIDRGLRGNGVGPASKLQPGDVLTLRGGKYVEDVKVDRLEGVPGNEITIRSFDGERAIIDGCLKPFRVVHNSAWVPARDVDATAREDEWVSTEEFEGRPNRGAFLDAEPYCRLVSHHRVMDFRADNQTFDKIFELPVPSDRGPWRVTDPDGNPEHEGGDQYTFPWVYMGPGVWFDEERATCTFACRPPAIASRAWTTTAVRQIRTRSRSRSVMRTRTR